MVVGAERNRTAVTIVASVVVIILFFILLSTRSSNPTTITSITDPLLAIVGSNGKSSWDPTPVEWTRTKVADLDFKPSKHKCSNAASNVYKTCIFENIVMYRGDLWYISPQPSSIAIPDPLIFEVGNSPSNDLSLPAILSVHPSKEAQATVAAEIGSKDASASIASYESAIFQRTRTFNNWFWAVNGAGNIFHRICKFFNGCDPESIRKTAVLQPIIESSQNLSEVGYVGVPTHHAQSVKDLMSCFGPLFWVNHPSGRRVDDRSVNQVLVFKKLLVGIGEDVVQPKAALDKDANVRFKQASNELSRKRVQFIRQCAGLAPTPPPPTRPAILLVNRPYPDGRSILGLDDVSDRLRRSLPFDVPVRIFLPRGDAGIADQARAFAASTVVVAPHGAATANFNFLPYDAVALGVFALAGRWGHDEAVGASMPAPPYNVTVWKVDCQGMTEARANAAGEVPEFSALPAKDQVALLLGREMNVTGWSARVKELLGISLLDWMDYRSYSPDVKVLTQQVLDGVVEWEKKVVARRRGRVEEEDEVVRKRRKRIL